MNANAIVIGDTFTVSDARIFDLPAVWRVERACFPKDAYDIFTLLNLALTPNVLRLKATCDERVVGYLAGEVRRSQRAGWIITIGVMVGRRFGRLPSFAVMVGMLQVGYMLLFWVQKGRRFITGIFGGFFPRDLVARICRCIHLKPR